MAVIVETIGPADNMSMIGWSIGCGTVSLAAPKMFGALGPEAFYIHAGFNLFAVAFVYCFYPETCNRTLEEIDLLFASSSPFVWETEKRFRELKVEHAELGAVHEDHVVMKADAKHLEDGGEAA